MTRECRSVMIIWKMPSGSGLVTFPADEPGFARYECLLAGFDAQSFGPKLVLHSNYEGEGRSSW